jgi:hypothetical protein
MTPEPKPRYLTKSRFKLALECPTKLFYTGKADIYPDCKREDEFLQALADGGFQVGELAKLMFPGGIEIKSRSHNEQITETARLLERDEVILFEAAIRHGNLFARVDVLRKIGSQIELIEVKAKSFDSTTDRGFRGARGGVDSGMKPYLQDVAFQRHVLSLAFPNLRASSFLMLADKAKTCSVDGLNQRFRIRRVDGRPVITVAPGTDKSTIGTPVLSCVNVDALVDEILQNPIDAPGMTGTLSELATRWAEHYRSDTRIPPTIGVHCAKCEFRADPPSAGTHSGLHDCWREAVGFSEADFAQGTVLDLWNFRGKQALIEQRVLRLADVPLDALGDQGGANGLSRGKRQAMQVTGRWPGRPEFYLDAPLMRREMDSWVFPLHFIDFETARVAIPFFEGQRPYANIAFQFSHHVVEADGRIDHRSQFLSTTPGRKPNYDFVRALQASLGSTGTVFMWSPHENTTLNAIFEELEQDPLPPPDGAVLGVFIRSLTTRKVDKSKIETASRALVDLCRLAEKAFFHPATKGSNSIKKVLPAVMQSSEYLKQRYSQPIYGAKGGVASLNFVDQVWWQEVGGVVADPYRLLPPVFTDLPHEVVEALEADDDLEIAQGGAATTAYARLQFEDIAPQERRSIEAALLRYCELDTLAMMMVYEAWRDWCTDIIQARNVA